MKRKIFSTLLMGAFVFASLSTVTSCKDYDDDINGLQTELASLKSSVTTLQSDVATAKSDAATAKSTAETAKTTAENALSLAQNAATKADLEAAKDRISTLETKIAKLDDLQSQITELKSKLEDLESKAATKDELKALQAEFDAIKGQFDALYQMVTSVELIGSYTSKGFITVGTTLSGSTGSSQVTGTTGSTNAYNYDGGHNHGAGGLVAGGQNLSGAGVTAGATSTIYTSPFDLTFETKKITDADFTFGKKEKDPKSGEHSATPQATYKKGTFVNFPSKLIVRVNPVNADVDPEDVSLVDSKGNDLSKLLKVTSVTRFNQLLTRAQETGLRVINLQLQDGVEKANVAQTSNGKSILYAVSINNTDSAATRYVVSSYDVTIQGATDYEGATSLDDVKIYSEQTMGADNAKTLANLKKSEGDEPARTGENYVIPAKSGENVIVDFTGLPMVDKFYIVRDDKYAGSSQESELNAWKSYSYTGLNQIIEVEDPGKQAVTITIPENLKTGDEVFFRIFAVNYDGTLVKTNGESFRVYVGGEKTTASVSGEFVATAVTGSTTGWLPLTGTLKDKTTGANTTLPSTVTFKDAANKTYTFSVEYAADANGTAAGSYSKIKYVKFTSTSTIKDWADGTSLSQVLTTKDANDLIENQISVTLTKTLPTVDYTKKLMNYTWKSAQLVDGVYTAYVYPEKPTKDSWTVAATAGYKDLNQAINGLATGFEVSIANAKLKTASNGSTSYADPLVANATPWTISVDNTKASDGTLLIDNTTKHETTISYNYGKVSSASDKDYIVTVETVNTIFACPLAKGVQEYTWVKGIATKATQTTAAVETDVNWLYYNETTPTGAYVNAAASAISTNLLDFVKGTNTFDNSEFGGTLSELIKNKYVSVKVVLISNENKQENEYFVPSIVKASGILNFATGSIKTNPTKDVESTLKITLTDCFGHENVYELPFTVKRIPTAAKKH